MYKYDLHVHTSEVSHCGWVDAEKIPHLYKEKGYKGIVITDHYKEKTFQSFGNEDWNRKMDLFMYGYKKAKEEAQKINIKVFFAIEITFNNSVNDFLVYGINETFLRNNPELYKLRFADFRSYTKNENILIYQAHPFQIHHLRKDMTVENPQMLDGVEVFNGNIRHDARNIKALKFAKDNHLKMVSGSDFHRPGDEGRGGIITETEILDDNQLTAFLNNRDYEIITTE